MSSILKVLKEDQYRIGNCQAVAYERQSPNFPDDYLGYLYNKMRGDRFNKRGVGKGFLKTLFCGMTDVSYAAIVSYLAQRPVIVVGVWTDESTFQEAGIGFPTVTTFGPGDERSCFFGYGIFQQWWGTPEAEVLGMLGLALTFNELNVRAMHGLRYADNDLTARFTARYGFRDIGVIPYYMLKDGKLVSAVASSLLRSDFEHYVERVLLDAYRDSIAQQESDLLPF